MPLLVRTPHNPAVVAATGSYVSALDVRDRKKTAVQRQLRRAGLAGYEPATQAALLTLVERSERPATFFDVGAHIGLYSVLVSAVFGRSGVRAHAFEPAPETLAECRRLAASNRVDIATYDIALSDTEGPGTLYLSDKAETSNSLTPGFRSSTRQVGIRTQSLDGFCAEHGVVPSVLKIDVETHEVHTLRGALGTLRQHRPWVVCELLPSSDGDALAPVLEQIVAMGYRLYPLDGSADWTPHDAADYRGYVSSGARDWLFAPAAVGEEFVAAYQRWLTAIAVCGPETNQLVPAGHALPKGWREPYRADRGAARDGAHPPGRPLAVYLRRLPWRTPYRVANWFERQRFTASHPQPAEREDVTVHRIGGRLRQVRVCRDLVTGEVAAHNLDMATELCDTGGVPYRVTSADGDGRHRLLVESGDWSRFVTALLAAGRRRPVYARITTEVGRRRSSWVQLVTEPGFGALLAGRDQLDVFEYVTAGGSIAGPGFGCRVDRWARDATGGLVAPGTNPRGAYLDPAHQTPAVVRVGDRELPSYEPFTRSNVLDVDFPVDVVYLWVDGSDPTWQQRKRDAIAAHPELHDLAVAESRFRDNGELRYSLRSLDQYAPWVRTVHLVTDRQVPDWLDTGHERLRVVHHEELFGNAGTAPSFNSQALGARLHHLDGLAEHYLHMNDDFFFGRPVAPSLFFHANGISKFFLSRSTLPWSDPTTMPPHEAARRNVVELLERDFGRTATRVFCHTPIPQRRSVLEELEKRYPDAFTQTWRSQFRAATDYEVNSWLHHYYAFLTGRAVPGSLSYGYFDVGRRDDLARMRRLALRRDRDVFCVNDGEDTTGANEVRPFLEKYFPAPSRFER